MKIQKKQFGGGSVGGGGGRGRRGRVGGGQDGCDWGGGGGGVRVGGVRVDVNEELKFLWKFKTKKNGGGGVRVGGGGQGGCEQRIEVFVKIKKKIWEGVRGSGWGVGWM